MLSKAKELKEYKLNGVDGEVGNIKDFLFDDKFWTVRYLIANTGSWLNTRKVLISPYFLQNVDYRNELIDVDLTKNEIEDSPELENDQSVSRDFEEKYFSYYGMPRYTSGPNMWGSSGSINRNRDQWKTTSDERNMWNSSLRSAKDVTGHDIQATDDKIGDVDDFIIDDETWAIRYLIIDTSNWLPGKKVIISPEWIDRISWDESKVFVGLSRDVIKNAPAYDEDLVISRDYETSLFRYYNRKEYWMNEAVTSEYSHR